MIRDFSSGYHARNGGGDTISTDGDLPVVDLTRLSGVPAGPPRTAAAGRTVRPAPTVFGGVLVFLRGIAALVLAASLLAGGTSTPAAEPDGPVPAAAAVLAVFGLAELVLAWGVLRGGNVARVVAMLLSAIAITAQAASVLGGGPPIDFGTNLLGLSLDILLIIALSSERSRAYARNRRRGRVRGGRVAAGLA